MGGTSDVTCIAEVGAELGDGPVWVGSEQALYWVDIPQAKVFRWSKGDTQTLDLDRFNVCSLVPRAQGGFVGGTYNGSFVAEPGFESMQRPTSCTFTSASRGFDEAAMSQPLAGGPFMTVPGAEGVPDTPFAG